MKKQLYDIIHVIEPLSIKGDTDKWVNGLAIDSRTVAEDFVYIAINGTQVDGHSFINQAITSGAHVVVCEQMPEKILESICYIQVKSSAEAAGLLSHAFYDNVSTKLKIVGVTGTNGKTTIATLLYQLFTDLGFRCGLLSTVHILIGEQKYEATHTTPDAISLNKNLFEMYISGCEYVFMEASSHAIHQKRLAGINFTGAIFSNITHDHLDYHKTFDNYIAVKKSWFDNLPETAFAISNLDDKRGKVMLQNCNAKKLYYSLNHIADFKGKILENSWDGLLLSVNETEVHFRLRGEFNAYNLLAVYGAAIALGQDSQSVLTALSNVGGAAGRFEIVRAQKNNIIGIVDYAHTPDALLNVLDAIKDLKQNQKLITIVGCGGNRDMLKRPAMASIAVKNSDKVVLTSDNPRYEDVNAILDDMEQGIDEGEKRKMLRIADRKEAIKTAVMLADDNDIILLAGKGHETYQEIMGVKYPFDDKEILYNFLNNNQ